MRAFFKPENPMRITHLVFAGALAASTMMAAPTLAKNSDAQKGEDRSAASSCSAYQQAPDGSWEPLPCKETGEREQPQTQHRTPTRGTDHEER
jgi:hypothetical protein